MRKYTLSKYNYFLKYDKYGVVYNSLHGTIVKVSKNVLDQLEYWSKESAQIPEFESSIMWKLKDNGIILEEKNDETDSLKKIYKEFQTEDLLHLIILPTEKCNLRCVYCYEDFKKGKMSEKIQKDILLYLKENIKNYKYLYISWFGGEPLLEIEIIKYLTYEIKKICLENNIEYHAGITTNGTLLTKQNFELLLECNVEDFQITLDGPKYIHDKQRVTINGKGTFTKIYENLQMIKNVQGQFNIVLRTNIKAGVDDAIYDYIDRVYRDFASDKRFKLHLVAIADLTGETKATIDLCDTAHLFPYYRYAKQKGISFEFYEKLFQPTCMVCYAANPHSFVIGSDGTVYKCTVAFNNSFNQIGKINEGKIMYDKKKMDLWIKNGIETSTKCKLCKFVPLCLGKFCPLEKIENDIEPCPPFEKYIQKYMRLFINE